jgi:hypothetical protein
MECLVELLKTEVNEGTRQPVQALENAARFPGAPGASSMARSSGPSASLHRHS